VISGVGSFAVWPAVGSAGGGSSWKLVASNWLFRLNGDGGDSGSKGGKNFGVHIWFLCLFNIFKL
jgi:hypothetical protein